MIKSKHTSISIAVIILLFLATVSFYLFSIEKISGIYIGRTHETVYNLKKDFLKYTVENIILEIDARKKAKAEHMERVVGEVAASIERKEELIDNEFNDFILWLFEDNPDNDFMTTVLWNNTERKAVYDPGMLAGATWEDTVEAITPQLVSFRIIDYGGYSLLFGVSRTYLDELVKTDIANTIRNARFEGGSYMWVNEILDYEGGEDYAVRRVHGGLPETEGLYLSTDLTDIKGNQPYLEELEGINKDGELFFTYYFKEPDTKKESEKLTYAKLYKDYDWVICMGVYLNDVQIFVDQTNEESKSLASRLTMILVILFVTILLFGYLMVMLLNKIYYRYSRKQLECEMGKDILTDVDARRIGTDELIRAFKEYIRSGISPGIVMLDIDHFKSINDKYGHFAGDIVLVEIVKAIKSMIRDSDKIIRWGGDEFILILYGMEQENILDLGKRILSTVSSLKILFENKEISPTISIGYSFFRKEDIDFTDAMKRADRGLYVSKSNGCNQINAIL